MLCVGLRFERRDAALLRSLAERVRRVELGRGDAVTFSNAAVAASTGEPLLVYCDNIAEAEMMADGYALYGVARPAIENLSGHRPG